MTVELDTPAVLGALRVTVVLVKASTVHPAGIPVPTTDCPLATPVVLVKVSTLEAAAVDALVVRLKALVTMPCSWQVLSALFMMR